jgi:integrase
MLKKAGMPETLTYHKLRHGAASLLLSQKVPIPAVSKYLGHSNSSITLRVYAHMIDGDDGLAGSAMDSMLL